MKKNILTVVVIALCLINLALSAVVVFSIVPMANRTNDLIAQVASVINLELEDPNAEKIAGDVPIENRETLEPITNVSGTENMVNLKKDTESSVNHVAIYDSITLTVDKTADDYKKVIGLIASNGNYVIECVSTTLGQRTYEEIQKDSDRSKLKKDALQRLNSYFETAMICDITVNNLKYQ